MDSGKSLLEGWHIIIHKASDALILKVIFMAWGLGLWSVLPFRVQLLLKAILEVYQILRP